MSTSFASGRSGFVVCWRCGYCLTEVCLSGASASLGAAPFFGCGGGGGFDLGRQERCSSEASFLFVGWHHFPEAAT